MVHDIVPTPLSPPHHEFEDKSKETAIAIQNGHANITEGSVSDGPSTAKAQLAPEKSSIFRPSNIEDVPVVNDPHQRLQRRKECNKVT